MKIISIAGEETNLMFHLLGIEGYTIRALRTKQFQQEYEQIMEDKDIGLVLLDEKHLPDIDESQDWIPQAPLKAAQFQALFEQTLGFVGTEYGE